MCKPESAPQDTAISQDPLNPTKQTTLHKEAQKALSQTIHLSSLSSFFLLTALSLTLPHAQSHRDALSCSTLCYGSLTSTKSFLSLIGSTWMGSYSDGLVQQNKGRNACLYSGCVASMVGLVLGVMATSIEGLWWSMIPGALLQQNFGIFKALFADHYSYMDWLQTKHDETETVTSSSDRAASVGQLGMAVGIAFMIGPLLGATLVDSYETATVLAVFLTGCSMVCIARLPTVPTHDSTTTETKKKTKINTFSKTLFPFLNVPSAKTPPALLLIAIRIGMALAYHIFNTIWTVSLKERFDFGPSDHGKFMSFVGLVFALSQGLVAKWIIKTFGSTKRGRVRILLVGCVLLGVGRYVAFQVQSLVLVYVMFGFIVTALGVVNTIFTADTCLLCSPSEIGGLYGVLEAAQSGAGMVGPVLGGSLAYIHPVMAPLVTVVGLYAMVFLLVFVGYEKIILNGTQKRSEKSKDD